MDCNTARLFIPVRRPGETGLDGPDAIDLETHLAQCGECNTLAMNQDRLDHSSERITADIYTHVRRPLQSDAAHRVAELIIRP